MNKSQLIGTLIVGMTFGTAWAVRGQFGHEQGAAWAGGIGALALVLVAQRNDWNKNVFPIAFGSAIGWGVTGMISYGRVIGYSRSDNFPNAFYGLLMLFIIGGLFGLLGGGLTGLSLESTEKKKVEWGRLMAEMVAGALLVYGLLVMQLGILMTPPRSEAWAFALGGGITMLWYMARNRFNSSLRVALLTSLGAGFGFAFGDFLQTVGNVLEINFNMWNVMEYSIGFFGGTALAYAVYSSHWPEKVKLPKQWENTIALLFLIAFIPLIIFRESFSYSSIEKTASLTSWIAAIIISAGIILAWVFKNQMKENSTLKFFFAGYLGVYISLSYMKSGALAGQFHLNHHLYVINFIVILLLLNRIGNPLAEVNVHVIRYGRYKLLFFGLLVLIFFLALISIGIHDGLPGAHNRFGV